MRSLLNAPEVIGNVYYYKGMIPHPHKFLETIEATNSSITEKDMISKWRSWESSDGDYTFGATKSIDSNKVASTSDEIKYIYGVLLSAIRISSKHYFRTNQLDYKVQSPISISRYDAGKFMGPHSDERTGAHVSGVLYLNDNYRGGELEFPSQGFEIKPQAGSMIIFPSSEIHDPKPASHQRYICPVFWYK